MLLSRFVYGLGLICFNTANCNGSFVLSFIYNNKKQLI